jgi:hypothetical protein
VNEPCWVGAARRCPGGPSQRDPTSGEAPCPGCGTLLPTYTDTPIFPPHLVWGDGTVLFHPRLLD